MSLLHLLVSGGLLYLRVNKIQRTRRFAKKKLQRDSVYILYCKWSKRVRKSGSWKSPEVSSLKSVAFATRSSKLTANYKQHEKDNPLPMVQ